MPFKAICTSWLIGFIWFHRFPYYGWSKSSMTLADLGSITHPVYLQQLRSRPMICSISRRPLNLVQFRRLAERSQMNAACSQTDSPSLPWWFPWLYHKWLVSVSGMFIYHLPMIHVQMNTCACDRMHANIKCNQMSMYEGICFYVICVYMSLTFWDLQIEVW